MMLRLSEVYGTAGNDIFSGSSYTVHFGLQGDDIFVAQQPFTEFTIFVGGSGNDRYILNSPSAIVIAESGNSPHDSLVANGIGLQSATTYAATVYGQHLVAFDIASTQQVTVLNYLDPASRIESIELADGIYTFSQIIQALRNSPNYLGDFSSWADLGIDGGYSDAELNEAIGFYQHKADILEHPIATVPGNFDGLAYIASYRDLIGALGSNANAGVNHYIHHGYFEGRTITFNALEYIASNSDLIAAFGPNKEAGAQHYIQHGHTEGRSMTLDGLQYIASNSDLIAAFGANKEAGAQHYIQHGHIEGRTSDAFNAQQYLSNYMDLQLAFGADLDAATVHFIDHGFAEGRDDIWMG